MTRYRIVRGVDRDGDLFYRVDLNPGWRGLWLWWQENMYWDKYYYAENQAFHRAISRIEELKELELKRSVASKVVYKV